MVLLHFLGIRRESRVVKAGGIKSGQDWPNEKTQDLRVVHDVVKDILIRYDEKLFDTRRRAHSQSVKEPAITPLAMAVGKIKCASLVMGVERTTNSNGGMTSLSLDCVSAG